MTAKQLIVVFGVFRALGIKVSYNKRQLEVPDTTRILKAYYFGEPLDFSDDVAVDNSGEYRTELRSDGLIVVGHGRTHRVGSRSEGERLTRKLEDAGDDIVVVT